MKKIGGSKFPLQQVYMQAYLPLCWPVWYPWAGAAEPPQLHLWVPAPSDTPKREHSHNSFKIKAERGLSIVFLTSSRLFPATRSSSPGSTSIESSLLPKSSSSSSLGSKMSLPSFSLLTLVWSMEVAVMASTRHNKWTKKKDKGGFEGGRRGITTLKLWTHCN